MNIGTENRILVWDAPVRVFHWLMVLCFAGAYLTAESERWRLIHVTLGYTLGGLIAFRLLWGVAGTRYARFASFVRGPAAVWDYLRTLPGGTPTHYTGHNPAGAVAIVLLLGAGAIIVATGWASYNEVGGEWLSALHEGASNTMLGIVAIHVAGVVVSSRLHRENLVRSMVTGNKAGARINAIHSAFWWIALLLLAAVLGFWWFQWQGAPVVVPA
jgi:cytochrome b